MSVCYLLYALAFLIQVPLILLKIGGFLGASWALVTAPWWLSNAATVLLLCSLMVAEGVRSWKHRK